MNRTKTIISFVLLFSLTLLPKAFAEERWRIYDSKGRYEGSVRQYEGGRMKMYDRKGRHERSFRDDDGGRMRIYDSKGRYEDSVRQDSGGRMKMYDRKGRYQGYVEDDRVYRRDGTLEHRIVPDKNNKKK